MTAIKTRSSRRAFFMHGGAMLGAGLATTAGASALMTGNAPSPDGQLACAQDREAIRQLHLAFTALVENQSYEAAAELFDEQADLQLSGLSASGKPAIRALFVDQYRRQTADCIHSAYRQNASRQADAVTLSDNRLQATATYHVDVALSTPLQGDSTVVQMARLQGLVATRRWETGRIDAKYVKTRGQWKVASLSYRAT